jgi:hypothetical protein
VLTWLDGRGEAEGEAGGGGCASGAVRGGGSCAQNLLLLSYSLTPFLFRNTLQERINFPQMDKMATSRLSHQSTQTTPQSLVTTHQQSASNNNALSLSYLNCTIRIHFQYRLTPTHTEPITITHHPTRWSTPTSSCLVLSSSS